VIQRPLDEVSDTDIDSLIANQTAENRTTEYKRELPGGADGDRKEFLADVSSFANTIGGDLIFGVAAVDGIPTSVAGIQATNVDSLVLRLDEMIRAGISPRVEHHTVTIAHPAGQIVLIRINQSWVGPHRVVFKGHDRFYARSTAGKYSLDVGDLRQAFLRGATIERQIGDFVQERVMAVAAGRGSLPMAPGGKLILHLVPLSSFAGTAHVDAMRYGRTPNLLPPLSSGGWNHRLNLQGVLTYNDVKGVVQSYVQLYRNGVIEAVEHRLLNREVNGQNIIPTTDFERHILQGSAAYLKVQNDLGLTPPVFAFVSLVGARGCRVPSVEEDSYPIIEDPVQIPGVTIMSFEEKPEVTLRPLIDMIWNACGVSRSPNFDAEGKWRPVG
jgi:hypothetical protein